MATTTPNLSLVKPATTDPVDITVINGNMDKIDAALPNTYQNVSSWLAEAESGDGATCFITKTGKLICLDLRTVSRVHAEEDVIATIPAGYRPQATIDVPAYVNAEGRGVIRIYSTGDVKVWVTPSNPTAGRIYLYCCYATN